MDFLAGLERGEPDDSYEDDDYELHPGAQASLDFLAGLERSEPVDSYEDASDDNEDYDNTDYAPDLEEQQQDTGPEL